MQGPLCAAGGHEVCERKRANGEMLFVRWMLARFLRQTILVNRSPVPRPQSRGDSPRRRMERGRAEVPKGRSDWRVGGEQVAHVG